MVDNRNRIAADPHFNVSIGLQCRFAIVTMCDMTIDNSVTLAPRSSQQVGIANLQSSQLYY